MWGCSPQRWEPVSLPLSRHIFKDSWETSESQEGCWLPGPRPGRSPSAPPRALSLPPPSGGVFFSLPFHSCWPCGSLHGFSRSVASFPPSRSLPWLPPLLFPGSIRTPATPAVPPTCLKSFLSRPSFLFLGWPSFLFFGFSF